MSLVGYGSMEKTFRDEILMFARYDVKYFWLFAEFFVLK